MRKSIRIALIAAGAVNIQGAIASQGELCSPDTCKVGDLAVTVSSKTDPFYGCSSQEISDYVSMIVGLAAMQAAITGELPNISDKTGEPEFTGQTGDIVNGLRAKARVSSFDEAVSSCFVGKSHIKVTILNIPKDGLRFSTYVMDNNKKRTFWMPISALNRIKSITDK